MRKIERRRSNEIYEEAFSCGNIIEWRRKSHPVSQISSSKAASKQQECAQGQPGMFALFYLLCIVSLVGFAHGGNVVQVQEPATKHSYSSASTAGGIQLAGVGVRVKQIGPVKAKVYSIGFYADKNSAVSRCKKLPVSSAKSWSSSKAFEEAIVDGNYNKHFVLRMARNVGTETMVEGVTSSVKPRMQGKDQQSLDTFKSILLNGLSGGAKSNTELRFETSGGNNMIVKINGKQFGRVTSPVLVKAFTKVYFDADSVSKSLKDDVAKTFFTWATGK